MPGQGERISKFTKYISKLSSKSTVHSVYTVYVQSNYIFYKLYICCIIILTTKKVWKILLENKSRIKLLVFYKNKNIRL